MSRLPDSLPPPYSSGATPYVAHPAAPQVHMQQALYLPGLPHSGHAPPAQAALLHGSSGIRPQPIHHVALSGAVDFLETPPPHVTMPQTPPHGPATEVRKVFFGRAKYECDIGVLCWMIRELSGVSPVVARAAGRGCFVGNMATDADVDAVCQWHRRVLHDHTGVWVARTEHQVAVLAGYMASRGFQDRCHRLPRDAMVVERQERHQDGSWQACAAAAPAPRPPAKHVHHHAFAIGPPGFPPHH
jgi:hypothetical protein